MLSFGVSHVSSLVVLLNTFLHEHFLFFIHLSYHTTRTLLYILNISKVTRSTSYAIKSHSGVKNCRVAETRAQQLPQVMSPKNLRPSRWSKIILEIHINYMMYRKKLGEDDHQVCIVEEVEEFGKIDQPSSNRRCTSTTQWKALQIQILKMGSYKKC